MVQARRSCWKRWRTCPSWGCHLAERGAGWVPEPAPPLEGRRRGGDCCSDLTARPASLDHWSTGCMLLLEGMPRPPGFARR